MVADREKASELRRCVCARPPAAAAKQASRSSEEQQRLLPLIDGFRDVNELMRVSKLGEFDTGKALFGLLSGAFLMSVGVREA